MLGGRPRAARTPYALPLPASRRYCRHATMKAIFTKWIGPTLTKPARIKAYDGDNSFAWSSDMLDTATRIETYWAAQMRGYHGPRMPAGTNHAAHYEAARRFVRAMKWNHADGTLVRLADGGTKEGYVWVMLDQTEGCAMVMFIGKATSPRHGFVYDAVPTKRSRTAGAGGVLYDWKEYGAILDSVFEMADAIATLNGTPPASAVERVVQAEGWRLLPRHKRAIVNALQS